MLQNCYCLNYKTNERQLASVPKWFVSCCFLSLCKMVRASLWSRRGGKSSQVEYLLCVRVDVTFGYIGFSYFIDKETLNKIFMRVACAEMAFFLKKTNFRTSSCCVWYGKSWKRYRNMGLISLKREISPRLVWVGEVYACGNFRNANLKSLRTSV